MEVTTPTKRTKSNEEESSTLTALTVDGTMFWTPAWSETSMIMDVAKLTRFSWWRLTARPDEVNLLVGRPFPVYRLSSLYS